MAGASTLSQSAGDPSRASTHGRVGPVATAQHIGQAVASRQGVVAVVSHQPVEADSSLERIVPRPAVQQVVAAAPDERVVAGPAHQRAGNEAVEREAIVAVVQLDAHARDARGRTFTSLGPTAVQPLLALIVEPVS